VIPGFIPVESLNANHDLSQFSCGKAAMDNWLRRHALANQQLDSSKTFVTCPTSDRQRVGGYYSLTVASVQRENAPATVSEGMPPYAIPVVVLARLARDEKFANAHLGAALLKDALIRTVRVASEVGIRAMFVDALDDEARGFYERFQFERSPVSEHQLFLPMNRIRASVVAAGLPMRP
jgi:hypothetical protein